MLSATVANPANPTYGIGGGADTEDMVYILSMEEVNEMYSVPRQRIGSATPWCLRRWGEVRPGWDSTVNWWLRTTGGMQGNVVFVGEKGTVSVIGCKANAPLAGVRPVITLDTLKRP